MHASSEYLPGILGRIPNFLGQLDRTRLRDPAASGTVDVTLGTPISIGLCQDRQFRFGEQRTLIHERQNPPSDLCAGGPRAGAPNGDPFRNAQDCGFTRTVGYIPENSPKFRTDLVPFE
jgi:hypothetical protein